MESTFTLKDASFEKQNLMLTYEEQTLRQKMLSNVKYNLTIAMPPGKPYFRGFFQTSFNMA